MNKLILFFIAFLSLSIASFGQAPKMLFVIDSIPLLNDPEEWNQLLQEDIADISVVKDKDSLELLGWGKMDGITYIFTKAYRSRPDSIRKIPSLRQMEMKNEVWNLRGSPYSGNYIDYYNNGSIQDEGTLLNGKLDGTLTVYFKNGNKKSVAIYKNGIADGVMDEYYKDGALMQRRMFVNGNMSREWKLYFINGQVQHEVKSKNKTSYDTAFAYYSTGKVKKMTLVRNGTVIREKKEDDLNYYTTMFNNSLNKGDIKDANNHFYKIWMIDSTSIDTYFNEGMLLVREHRFDQAIADFDKALSLEPLMREALAFRALARLKKYQFLKAGGLAKNYNDVYLTVEDMIFIPTDEQEKICSDLELADRLDFTDLYLRRMVPQVIINYCKEKKGH